MSDLDLDQIRVEMERKQRQSDWSGLRPSTALALLDEIAALRAQLATPTLFDTVRP